MKKLIVFILAAVLVSCSQKELKKLSKQYEVEKTSKFYKVTYSYNRTIDTINVSGQYIIVAVYTSVRGISTEVIGKLTRLD